MLVLMDTNACIYVIKRRADLSEALERVFEGKVSLGVLKECVLESKRLGIAERRAFERFMEAFKPRVLEGGQRSVDGAVLSYAVRTDCVVCTGDADLRRKLKEKGVRVLLFKPSGMLEFA